jgi:hypothetical protein
MHIRNNHEFRDQAGAIESSLRTFRELKNQVLVLASNRGVAVDYRESIIYQIKMLHREQNAKTTLADFIKEVDASIQELRCMKLDLEEIIAAFQLMINFDDEEAMFALNEEEIGVEL